MSLYTKFLLSPIESEQVMKSNLFFALVALLLLGCKTPVSKILDTQNSSFIIYTYDEFGAPMGSGSGFFISEIARRKGIFA